MIQTCAHSLRKLITKSQEKIVSDTTTGLKHVSELQDSYPNLYLILRLLPPLQPIADNLQKFSDLYPYFIKACGERNSMYPDGLFRYRVKSDQLPTPLIEQLSALQPPTTYMLGKKSPLCSLSLPIDEFTQHIFDTNPLLKEFKSAIVVNYGDVNTSRYYPDKDIFKITINTHDCKNHQFMTLVHHLGYANFWLSKFQENVNPYTLGNFAGCKGALQFNKQYLKTLSIDLYNEFLRQESDMADLLAFEMSLYSQLPNKPSTIFKAGNLESPYLFLSYEAFFTRPLENITHVAAFLATED